MDKRATVLSSSGIRKRPKRKEKSPGFQHQQAASRHDPGKMAGRNSSLQVPAERGQLTPDVPGREFQDCPDAEFAPPHHAPTPNTCC